MRKMSARRGRQSLRKARKMRFSPFWLKIRIPDSMVASEGGRAHPVRFQMKELERGEGDVGVDRHRLESACGGIASMQSLDEQGHCM